MKQGSGNNRMSGGKVEPKAHSISVDKVSHIGNQVVRIQPVTKNLVNGRGFEAPKPVKHTTHKSGSQSKKG